MTADELIGRAWVDLSAEDLHRVTSDPDLRIGGSGRVVWADPRRRTVVGVNLFGVLAEADAWVEKVSGVRRTDGAGYTIAQAREHLCYPLLPHMESVQLHKDGRHLWKYRGGPRAKPHSKELLLRLRQDLDMKVCVVYPEIDECWCAGVVEWLNRKLFLWDDLKPVPIGADLSGYLGGISYYIDNHPGRAVSVGALARIKKVSLVRNSWNHFPATAKIQRSPIQKIITQYHT